MFEKERPNKEGIAANLTQHKFVSVYKWYEKLRPYEEGIMTKLLHLRSFRHRSRMRNLDLMKKGLRPKSREFGDLLPKL